MLTNTAIGLIGEYIAASSILELGYRVSLSQQDKVDLVAWHDDEPDLFLRIQVKSCDITQRKEGRFQFNLACGKLKKAPKAKDHDIIAMVSIHDRKCAFYATATLNQTTKRFGKRFFQSPDIEAESWQKAVGYIREGRR